MNFGAVVDRLVKKTWSDEDILKYVGKYQYAALTYATNDAIRQDAASGGTISALMIHGLRTKLFEGVVVCKTVLEEGKVRARFEIATTEEAILDTRGSKYVETAFLREVLPLIREFEGRVAVVGLPCDITALRHRSRKEPVLADKLALTVALLCGHNSRKELIDHVTSRIEKQAGSPLKDYKFRIGHWRGKIEARFTDGRVMQYPTAIFNNYQNLFFFCEKKCLACHDHYGYDADISVGDVWLFRLKKDPVKRTGVIIRNAQGAEVFDHAVVNGAVATEAMDIRDIMDGQSRIGPSHYNVSARVKVGRHFGIKLKDTVNEPVHWYQWLNAYLSIANMRWSEHPKRQIMLFAIPRPMIKLYLYFKKALETLR